MSDQEKTDEIFKLKETDTVKLTEKQAILYSGDCIFKYQKNKVNTKKVPSVNYACTTIFKKDKENNCKASLTVREKRPKSYDMQLGDKYIIFGKKPHTEVCCLKARTRRDKEETLKNFSAHVRSNGRTTASQALMSDNIQRFIKYGNSYPELTMAQRRTLFNNNKKKFNEDKNLNIEKAIGFERMNANYYELVNGRYTDTEVKIDIFYSNILMHHAAFTEYIFIDGSFSKKPPEFEQLLAVNFKEPVTGVICPLLFALIGKKTAEAYEHVFDFIKDNFIPYLSWKKMNFLCDFEEGMVKALEKVFKAKGNIKNCYFHLREAIYKKFLELNLKKKELSSVNQMIYSEYIIYLFTQNEESYKDMILRISQQTNSQLKSIKKEGKSKDYKNFFYYLSKKEKFFSQGKIDYRGWELSEISNPYMENFFSAFEFQIRERRVSISSIKEHIVQTLYLYTEKVKEKFSMNYKKRENIKTEEKRKRIEIRGFLLKKLSDFALSFKERLDNEIPVKGISPEEKKEIGLVKEMSSFEIECVSKAMNDYLEKCDAEEDIPSFNKKKAKWYPYEGLEEVKVKIKEEDPSQREARNKNANEASNEISNRVLRLSIMEYEALTDLTNSNKKKIEEEVLKCVPFFFVFSNYLSAWNGFPIDKAKKIFCLVCGKLLVHFYGVKFHLTSSVHKSNSSFAFGEENKTCKIIVNLNDDTKESDIHREGGKWYVDIREDYCRKVNIYPNMNFLFANN